jgi:hypothetical protein
MMRNGFVLPCTLDPFSCKSDDMREIVRRIGEMWTSTREAHTRPDDHRKHDEIILATMPQVTEGYNTLEESLDRCSC